MFYNEGKESDVAGSDYVRTMNTTIITALYNSCARFMIVSHYTPRKNSELIKTDQSHTSHHITMLKGQ